VTGITKEVETGGKITSQPKEGKGELVRQKKREKELLPALRKISKEKDEAQKAGGCPLLVGEKGSR